MLYALVRHGLTVWLPWSRFGAYDLLVDNREGGFVRAQVKSGRVRENCVVANTRSSDHGNGRQSDLGRADVIIIHAAETDEQFVVPVEEACGFDIRLRLSPARNNQQVGVRYARDYRLADSAANFAAVATLHA